MIWSCIWQVRAQIAGRCVKHLAHKCQKHNLFDWIWRREKVCYPNSQRIYDILQIKIYYIIIIDYCGWLHNKYWRSSSKLLGNKHDDSKRYLFGTLAR